MGTSLYRCGRERTSLKTRQKPPLALFALALAMITAGCAAPLLYAEGVVAEAIYRGEFNRTEISSAAGGAGWAPLRWEAEDTLRFRAPSGADIIAAKNGHDSWRLTTSYLFAEPLELKSRDLPADLEETYIARFSEELISFEAHFDDERIETRVSCVCPE